jgi:hypothetical protein
MDANLLITSRLILKQVIQPSQIKLNYSVYCVCKLFAGLIDAAL